MELKIKPLSNNFKAPTYGTSGAAAFDIRSPHCFTLDKGETMTIGLGFAAEIPKGYVGLILPRSGLGSSHGMGMRNTIGAIDSDYRGEWKATITRDVLKPLEYGGDIIDNERLYVSPGDRILQCMIIPVEQVDFVITDTLSETERGTGGYGSTGIK